MTSHPSDALTYLALEAFGFPDAVQLHQRSVADVVEHVGHDLDRLAAEFEKTEMRTASQYGHSGQGISKTLV